MKHIISFVMSILFVIGSQVFAQIVETHEFGAVNTQYFIYSSGVRWEFIAQNTMTVKTVEVKSVLASDPLTMMGTFHIELSIQDSLIAKWDQYVNTAQYQAYFHTKQVSYSLTQGDTIVYEIYGNPGYLTGGLLGINHVKLTGEEITDVEFVDTIPAEFLLSQNYPNPFNPSTTIEFSLPRSGDVMLKVYNTLGAEVTTLVSENLSAGHYSVQWDGKEHASGVYFYRMSVVPEAPRDRDGQAGQFVETRKLLLLR